MKYWAFLFLLVFYHQNSQALVGCPSPLPDDLESTTLNRHCGQNVPNRDDDLTTPRNSTLTNGILHQQGGSPTVMHCGECESTLQNGFNGIMNDIMCVNPSNPAQPDRGCRGSYQSDGHWSEASASPPGNIGIKQGKTMQGTLNSIIDLMKRQNGGKLNYTVISNSDSAQKTRPGYPRIALKSPNSELQVTFNTDPNSPGYNTLEIMRWNGKKGKYEFQEIDFGESGNRRNLYDNNGNYGHNPRTIPARPAHVDLTGDSCKNCHKDPTRPNWGTYRAWAGISPPRDDMIERDPKHTRGATPAPNTASGCQTNVPNANGSGMQPCPRIDPNGEGYLNFLDSVARSRSSTNNGQSSACRNNSRPDGLPASCRLALLPIPWNPRQMDPTANGGGTALSNTQCNSATAPTNDTVALQCIRDRVMEDGYYRVPHFPEPGTQKKTAGHNVDCKTARWAGPSHAAFDQMLAQNMCQVMTNLKYNENRDAINPNWNKYKYALAGILNCADGNSASFSQFANFLPANFHPKARSHYLSSQGSGQLSVSPDATAADSTRCPASGTRFSAGNAATGQQVYNAVKRNTQCSHMMADQYKYDGQEEYIQGEFFRQNCGTNYWRCPPHPTKVMDRIAPDANNRLCVCYYTDGTRGQAWERQDRRALAASEATRMAQNTRMRPVSGYHAIPDPGGVKGVAEAKVNQLAFTRYLLEPLGIDVGEWSMVFGKNSSDNSFSFSDQFLPLLKNQQIIKDVMSEVGGNCATLAQRSRAALQTASRPTPPPSATLTATQTSLQNACNYITTPQTTSGGTPGLVNEMGTTQLADLRSRANGLLRRCVGCHSNSGVMSPFPTFVTSPVAASNSQLKTWLNCSCSNSSGGCAGMSWSSRACGSGRTNLDILANALDPANSHHVGLTRPMPPSGWSPSSEDADKRSLLRVWLRSEALVGNSSATGRISELRSKCSTLLQGISSPAASVTTPGTNGGQHQ